MDDPLDIPKVPPSVQVPESVNTAAKEDEQLPFFDVPFTVTAQDEPSETKNPSPSETHAQKNFSVHSDSHMLDGDLSEGSDSSTETAQVPESLSLDDSVAPIQRTVEPSAPDQPAFEVPRAVYYKVSRDISYNEAASRRRNFRQNLLLLLALTLAAFTLTIWILVRVESPFGIFSTGPQEIVRAQLRALDRGDLRPAYDMFSARYRGQVSFDDWHELVVTHRRIFHAEVLGAEMASNTGPGVTLEIYLHSANDKDYRARFTLVRTNGRWWIDDVHWSEEPDERDISRT